MELSTRFNFKEIENKWCQHWEKENVFHAQPNPTKKPYTIVIPPPNVTGILHMGHALNNTLQDIIIRYKRMKGFETCWIPGTDHAGIATQNVVEKQIAKEGKTRHDLGREEMLKKLWNWKEQYGDTIINQLKKLGASCDWPRTRFTMDEGYCETVKTVFVKLYEKGLIYQGEYIINWCPRCQTALSDEEAEHQETQGKLYYIKYSFKNNSNEGVTVATTRPETMLGDTAVAVNPKDKRYKNLIGKSLILPIIKREIKIISDDFVDQKFGTGAVKVTPAHDPNDFAMAKRHKLAFINIMHPNATLNNYAGKDFEGMNRFKARELVIEKLKAEGVLQKIEPHTHSVGHCYRCHTVVEPYLSKQWFVKMAPLAKPALEAVKKGKIKFYPKRWTKVYTHWMENIRDWCISRQIWWGHRIPVWYCVGDDKCKLKCKEPIVSEKPPTHCPHCGSANLIQDEDVLDTWFSSWLWPFATFNWPQKNKDLEYFYPGNALFTASEIIFFWVARMIIAGLEFMKNIPFSEVYIHGTVRDTQGRKMSKSLGNALDPLEIIEEYGADALRFSLIINSGQDLFISKEKFEIGRNFANKIWNAARLILMNIAVDPRKININDIDKKNLDLDSKWILSEFYKTLQRVEQRIEDFRFSEAEIEINAFFWSSFCDWYLEIIKSKFSDENYQKVALHILINSLKMIHPFMPFVTEEIWSKFDFSSGCLAQQNWPEFNKNLVDLKAEKIFGLIKIFIYIIRRQRTQWNITPQDEITCYVHFNNKSDKKTITQYSAYIKDLGKIKNFIIQDELPKGKNLAKAVVGATINIAIPLEGVIDIAKEKQRILAQTEQLKQSTQDIKNRLNNKNFLKKAPKDVVEKDRNRLQSLEAELKKLKIVIKNLET